jgi:endo-1,4-beta-xylanase
VISRRTLLTTGAAALAFPAQAQESRSLKSIAASKGIVFGTAAATYELKHRDFVVAALRDCAQFVPEYEMKRDALEPQRGQYNFTDLDALFAFAALNGLSMRGHPLVWYYANPPWLEPALKARRDERLMTSFIQTVMQRYRMVSVDVVNEAIATDGNGLRPSMWLDAFGPRYIDMAFHAARAANPVTKLIYNDWGCEQGPNDRFRATTLKLLDGLIARRVPIDGLGLQGHLEAFGPKVDQRKLHSFLEEVRARGLSIMVTELDVLDSGGPSNVAQRDSAVADEARRFLDVVLDNPATNTVLTWSLSDRYVDPPDEWKLKLMGFRYRKMPYDDQMRKKPLWNAIAQSLAGRRSF